MRKENKYSKAELNQEQPKSSKAKSNYSKKYKSKSITTKTTLNTDEFNAYIQRKNKEFANVVSEFNKNILSLKKEFKDVPSSNKKNVQEDRDLYFQRLIEKQLRLGSIPTDSGVYTFDLLSKRVTKLYAIISTYVKGEKHDKFKSDWGQPPYAPRNDNLSNLPKEYKEWMDYFEKLMTFVSNKKSRKTVEKLFAKKIGGKAQTLFRFNKKVAISELKQILCLNNDKHASLFHVENIVTILSNLRSKVRKQFYERVKKLFFLVHKNIEMYKLQAKSVADVLDTEYEDCELDDPNKNKLTVKGYLGFKDWLDNNEKHIKSKILDVQTAEKRRKSSTN